MGSGFTKLQELLDRPTPEFYDKMTRTQEQQIMNGAISVGGKLISNALERRRNTDTLMQLVKELPAKILSYSEEDTRYWGGLLPEMREVAVYAASLGRSRADICKLLAVTQKRFQTWIERGLEGESPFNSFVGALLRTEVFADMKFEDDVHEAIALELKTTGASITMLKRRDERRKEEEMLFQELPLKEFTDEELAEYEMKGKIPDRFKGGGLALSKGEDYVDGELEDDFTAISLYRKKAEVELLEQEVLRLRKQLGEGSE